MVIIILELYQLGTLVKLYYINDHIGYKRSIIIGLKTMTYKYSKPFTNTIIRYTRYRNSYWWVQ